MASPTLSGALRNRLSDGLWDVLARLAYPGIGSVGLRIAGVAVSFSLGVQLARYLGPAGYGIYGVVISIAALASVLVQFGLPQLMTREIAQACAAQDWGRLAGVLRWARRAIVVSCILVLLPAGVVLTLWPWDRAELYGALLWGLPLVLFLALGNLAGASLQGLQRTVAGQAHDVVLRPALLSVLLFAVAASAPTIRPGTAILLHAVAAAAAWLALLLWRRAVFPAAARGAVPAASSPTWKKTALAMVLAEGLRTIHLHMSILLLGWLSVAASVGHYSVAASTAGLVALPISLLNIIAAPVLASLHSTCRQNELQLTAASVSVAMTAGTAMLALPFLLAGERLLAMVFGSDYAVAIVPLLVLCLGQVVSAFFGLNATLLNMTGNEWAVTRALCCSALVVLVLGALSIPRWGIGGAALANAAGLIVWNVAMWRSARRLTGIDTSLLAVTLLFKNRVPDAR